MKQICNRCVMDSEVPDIHFNEEGNCNYCEDFLEMMSRTVEPDPIKRKEELNRFVEKVKSDGRGKEYDCIIGLSGGVDSAWVLYQAKKMGLRPLAVHMDNGWNSELAQSNIEGLVRTLDIDLHTHVIDWTEYRELMQAFFDADVVDVELLYDNAMYAVNYQLAAKFNIKWILAGTNKSTEGMRIPRGWNWFKFDRKNIKKIASTKGITHLNTFPSFGVLDFINSEFIRKKKWISFLDMFEYRKEDALITLEKECGYRRYPYKHYESIFTRFYQGYLLPKKFGIDKRKVHLSTLVTTNQMQRTTALDFLTKIPYPTLEELEIDKNYFIKKMLWTDDTLQQYLSRAPKDHLIYGSELPMWKFFSSAYKFIFRKK